MSIVYYFQECCHHTWKIKFKYTYHTCKYMYTWYMHVHVCTYNYKYMYNLFVRMLFTTLVIGVYNILKLPVSWLDANWSHTSLEIFYQFICWYKILCNYSYWLWCEFFETYNKWQADGFFQAELVEWFGSIVTFPPLSNPTWIPKGRPSTYTYLLHLNIYLVVRQDKDAKKGGAREEP